MILLAKGKYQARITGADEDLQPVLDLRARAFALGARSDRDAYDDWCKHVLIEDVATTALLGSFRIMFC